MLADGTAPAPPASSRWPGSGRCKKIFEVGIIKHHLCQQRLHLGFLVLERP
jgi:hypothetical protein